MRALKFEYDVFLSHASQDGERAERLAKRLRSAGLSVWFDGWMLPLGTHIYGAILAGLEASRVMMLCLTPAALGSEWVQLERNTYLFRDPTERDRVFIPLLLDDCQPPSTIQQYRIADYRVERDAVFEELVRACRPASKRRFGKSAGREV